MKAYSQVLRLRILEAADASQTEASIAQRFAVGLTIVKRYLAECGAGGHVRPRTAPGRSVYIDPDDDPALKRVMNHQSW